VRYSREIVDVDLECHGTKCPLLTAFFLSLFSGVVTFLPEGVIVGFPNFAWGFKSQKINKIWDTKTIGGPGSIF
jgi:hypothetical protein